LDESRLSFEENLFLSEIEPAVILHVTTSLSYPGSSRFTVSMSREAAQMEQALLSWPEKKLPIPMSSRCFRYRSATNTAHARLLPSQLTIYDQALLHGQVQSFRLTQ
jgi:hypothetical protein